VRALDGAASDHPLPWTAHLESALARDAAGHRDAVERLPGLDAGERVGRGRLEGEEGGEEGAEAITGAVQRYRSGRWRGPAVQIG
jgi:hypothetical protein